MNYIIHIYIDFIEKMKSLGYPKLISIDSLRTPDFSFVSEILFWLVKR